MSPDRVEVIVRARDGDREALRELYDLYAPYVRTIALDRSGDPAGALDICHEVFLVVLEGLSGLRDPSRFGAWISGITRRKAVDHRRRRDRAPRPGAPEGDEAPAAPEAPDVVEREALARLRAAIDGLEERERVAVQLFHIEGESAGRVAELLELPLRTVYAVLDRARQRMRAQLEREGTRSSLAVREGRCRRSP